MAPTHMGFFRIRAFSLFFCGGWGGEVSCCPIIKVIVVGGLYWGPCLGKLPSMPLTAADGILCTPKYGTLLHTLSAKVMILLYGLCIVCIENGSFYFWGCERTYTCETKNAKRQLLTAQTKWAATRV